MTFEAIKTRLEVAYGGIESMAPVLTLILLWLFLSLVLWGLGKISSQLSQIQFLLEKEFDRDGPDDDESWDIPESS